MKRTVNHFKAAMAVAAALVAAMALPYAERQEEISGIKLKHRGKGKGTPSRVYGNPLGRYLPHQSVRECARRVEQARNQNLK